MLDIASKPQATAVDAAEALDIFGATLFVFSDGSSVPMAVGEQHVPPGYGVPTHVHEFDDELFYILGGELIMVTPEGEAKAGPGACVSLPRGIPHGFRNAAEGPARMLVVLTPGVQGLEMFRHFDRAGRAAPLTPGNIAGIAGQYGVRFV